MRDGKQFGSLSKNTNTQSTVHCCKTWGIGLGKSTATLSSFLLVNILFIDPKLAVCIFEYSFDFHIIWFTLFIPIYLSSPLAKFMLPFRNTFTHLLFISGAKFPLCKFQHYTFFVYTVALFSPSIHVSHSGLLPAPIVMQTTLNNYATYNAFVSLLYFSYLS